MKKNKLTKIGSDWGGTHLSLDLIPPGSLIISCGISDDITFDTFLIENKNCFIVGVDPTEKANETIQKYYEANSAIRQKFNLMRKAVHARTGLVVVLGGSAHTLLSPAGEPAVTISLEDLVLTYPGASVLKLDIEGAEFVALESLTLRLRIPQLAISFHTWLNSSSDQYPNTGVPEGLFTERDVLECCQKIKNMGYKLVYESHEDNYRLGQETLFIRKEFASNFKDIRLKPIKKK